MGLSLYWVDTVRREDVLPLNRVYGEYVADIGSRLQCCFMRWIALGLALMIDTHRLRALLAEDDLALLAFFQYLSLHSSPDTNLIMNG